MKTVFIISGRKHHLKYQRKMPEKEVNKMKSFVTAKGEKLVKSSKFEIKTSKLRKTKKSVEEYDNFYNSICIASL